VPAREEPDLLRAIERGEIAPIYCLHGPERFLIDRVLAALRHRILGATGDASGCNCELFDLKEVTLIDVLAAARTLPMFAKQRLVIARGLEQVKAEGLEPLTAYASHPNPSTCLVLLAEKVDGRLRAFLALRKAGFLHEFARLKDRDLGPFIAREAKTRGLAIDSDAALALANAAGPDLGRLMQALEQLEIYAGKGGRISRVQIEELVPESRERNVFELTKAIGTGDARRALQLVTNMLRNREPPLRIQAMLMRQLRQIWRAKELSAANLPRAELAAAVGLPPFFLDDVLVPARRLSVAALRRSFERLYQADRAFKSSRVDPEVQLTRLVRQLAEEASAPRR
jgi:DNA polymerase-3 subunit delta